MKFEQLFPLEIVKDVSEEHTAALGATYASEVAIMIEAKKPKDGSRQTLFTLEHF